MEHVIDTSDLSVDQVADLIMQEKKERASK